MVMDRQWGAASEEEVIVIEIIIWNEIDKIEFNWNGRQFEWNINFQ